MTTAAAGQPVEVLATRAWTGLRALVHDRYDRRREVCEELGLGFVRVKALRRLAAGPQTMRELAAGLSTDPPYTTIVVDDLERRGLVERTRQAADRRVKTVTATPAGLRVARRAEEILGEPPGPVRELEEADLLALDRIIRTLLAS